MTIYEVLVSLYSSLVTPVVTGSQRRGLHAFVAVRRFRFKFLRGSWLAICWCGNEAGVVSV